MFNAARFNRLLPHPGYWKKDSEAPDYQPMADASEESARIMGELGQDQLDFSKQQYDELKPLYEDLTKQQMDIADQTAAQGQDYYDYLKSYRPTERSMNYESMGLNADEVSQLESMYYANERAGLGENGYLAGREAEVEALYKQLGMTPQQLASTTTTTSTTGGEQGTTAPRSFKDFFMGSLLSSLGAEKDTASDPEVINSVISEVSSTNPEYAATLANLTDAQKSLLVEQARAESARDSGQLDYEQKLSEFGTAAGARRQSELDAGKALDEADAKIIGGQDGDVYGLRRNEIEQGVGRAVADVNQGYSSARAQNERSMMGLGINPNSGAFASGNRSMMFDQARTLAGATNSSRTAGIEQQRGIAATNMGLRRDITANQTAQKSVDWAKKLDAAGLVKGLPGASTGAYGLAVSAGNSAGQNASAAGQNYSAGLTAGANTIASGRSMYQSGLGDIMDSQTGLATGAQAAGASTTGAALGAAGGIAVAVI